MKQTSVKRERAKQGGSIVFNELPLEGIVEV